MQTAIEQLMIAIYEGGYLKGNGNEMDDILEKYKEVEKQQIIDAYQAGDGDAYNLEETEGWAKEYYNETYGGKGSDEHYEDNLDEIPTSSQTTSDKWKEYQDWLNEVPQISDEEIEKFIEENYKPNYIRIFVWEGIKWYREQLKNK